MPDGSHWALQRWPRLWANYGGHSGDAELHVSHWTGSVGVLDIHTDWGYHGRWRHLYGTFTYHGKPVFGLDYTPQGVPLDAQGRNVYVDYHADGIWQRENSFLTHEDTGGFCYLFSRHDGRVGNGNLYRATAIGPGREPDRAGGVQPAGRLHAEGGRRGQPRAARDPQERPPLQDQLTASCSPVWGEDRGPARR